MNIGDAVIGSIAGNHFGLQHLATIGTDWKERAVGGLSLSTKRRQHDRHDCLIAIKNCAQSIVKIACLVAAGRTDKFIIKPEGVQKRLQSRIVVITKGRRRTERVFHSCQRHIQIGDQLIRVWQIGRDLAKPIHIIGKTYQPCSCTCHRLKGMTHHRRTHNLAEGANMRQPRWTISGFKDHLILATCFLKPLKQITGFGERPRLRITGDLPQGRNSIGHIRFSKFSYLGFTIRNPHSDQAGCEGRLSYAANCGYRQAVLAASPI